MTECESAGSTGLSGASVTGRVPILGKIQQAAHLQSEQAQQMALANAMRQGAVSAQSLAAGIGAAAPAYAPVAAPVAAAPAAPAQIGSHQATSEKPKALHHKTLAAMLASHELPFCFQIEASLSELRAGTISSRQSFSVPLPEGARTDNVVLEEVLIDYRLSSARLPIGVKFPDLPAKTVQLLPGGQRGTGFHAIVPAHGHAVEFPCQSVYRLTELVNPNHVLMYSALKDRADLFRGVTVDEAHGMANVPFNIPLGDVVYRNRHLMNDAVVMKSATNASASYAVVKLSELNQIADRVESQVIKNPNFRRSLAPMSNFQVEIVPLNASNVWTDVPELNVEDPAIQQREQNRRFTLLISGRMKVLVVSAADDAACGK